MHDTLTRGSFEPETITLDGRTLKLRAARSIPYCEHPKDAIQTLNIFAPEAYFEGGSVIGYDAETALIFCSNTVGGYLPGAADELGEGRFSPTNAAFEALAHGYVVASIGVRGRTTGERSAEFFEGSRATAGGSVPSGVLSGRAPAFIVDLKAGIRFLRANASAIPGNLDCIVTNGTSAGGALSALAGASGDSPDFEEELERIGAVMDERDDIFAASCYCPIHNLEHADAAYEWLFHGIADCHFTHFRKRDGKIARVTEESTLTPEQMAFSDELAASFPTYVSSLGLTRKDGEPLTLEADGRGSFLDCLESELVASAQKELDTKEHETRLPHLMCKGSIPAAQPYLTIEDGKVTALDWDGYVHAITRMKPCPSFDSLDLRTPENQEFGDEHVYARHFTDFAQAHSTVPADQADGRIVRMMNTLSYASSEGCCQHWRIRHGPCDRDTSLAIPLILALSLEDAGKDVDFAFPWGLPHSGDYDLDGLFTWIDRICQK